MKKFSISLYRLATFHILLIIVLSASPATAQTPAITEFKFEVQYNTGKITDDIIADIYGDTLIVGIIPFQVTDLTLVPTFSAGDGQDVTVDGVVQESTVTANDFTSGVDYVVSSATENHTYKVRLVYTGLPLVYIYTDGEAPILNKEDYVNGTVKILPNTDTLATFSSAMGIRGRGNTTWTLPKKPYRIKLGSAASVLGMPSGKDWVLLANYSDKTLMRNTLAFYLGHNMNLAYTPRTTLVDVVLNGVYQGNYQLGEHVKVDKNRVKIKELKAEDTDPAVITGGYFLELDDYRDGIYFELASGLPFVIKSPDEDELTEAQMDFIKGYMQETENAIFSPGFADPATGYAKYINPETFIEWYWVSEVLKNIDARDVSSIYYYKDRDEKLNMGPLWDFDVAAGNATVSTGEDPSSFYVRESKWFKRLFEDPAFKNAADARWQTLKEELLDNLPHVIDSLANKLQRSQQLNFYEWNILNQPIWPSTLVFGTYENEVNYLKQWLTDRIEWIDAHTPKPEPPIPPLVASSLISPVDNTRILVTPGDST